MKPRRPIPSIGEVLAVIPTWFIPVLALIIVAVNVALATTR